MCIFTDERAAFLSAASLPTPAPAVRTAASPPARRCRAAPRRAARMVQPAPSPAEPPPAEPSAVAHPLVTDEMLAAAHEAADAAADVIRRYFRRSAAELGLSAKADASPVTAADREAEAAIRAVLSAAFPGHAVLGEEAGLSGADADEFVWVIDPIDGTKAFVAGRPTFATLIALAHRGRPVLGLIDQPVLRERWVGLDEVRTTLNGAPVRVRPEPGARLHSSVVHATTPEMFVGLDGVAFRALRAAAAGVVYGSDCYAYAMLASGCAQLVVEADLKPWDFMALVPVVRGAGGAMSDWSGEELCLWSDGRVVAAASEDVLAEAVELLLTVDDSAIADMSPEPSRVSEPIAVPATSHDPASSNGSPPDPGPGHVESMTGFGASLEQLDNLVIRAEIRSVNSRYCDVQVRGPRQLMAFDSEIIAMVKKEAARGKLVVSLDVSTQGKNSGDARDLSVMVDTEAAKAVRRLLDELASASGIPSQPTLANVMTFSEVFVRREPEGVGEQVLQVAKKAVLSALEDLRASRRREGAILELDLMKRTRKIRDVLDDIEQRAPERVKRERQRLSKLTKEINDGCIGENRLEYEVTLFADRLDITEEVVRLRAHLSLFDMTFLGPDEPIGQRLTFLLQEMHREATTMGAKAADAPIAHLVVLIKEEVEKIREQCQNIR